MHYRLVAGFLFVAALGVFGLAQVAGQGAPPQPAEKPADKPAAKPAEEKKEPEVLDAEGFETLMDDIKGEWNKLKLNLKKKTGEPAAAAADALAKHAPNVLKFDGPVLEGEAKGKKAREQQDFKDWVKALEDASKEFSKHAKAGDWEKAGAEKEKIGKTCSGCHDKYEPEDEEEDEKEDEKKDEKKDDGK